MEKSTFAKFRWIVNSAYYITIAFCEAVKRNEVYGMVALLHWIM